MKILSTVIITAITLFNSSKINAQEITIFPGFWGYEYYQDDERIDRKQLISLLETNQESYDAWKESNNLRALAWVSLAAETGLGIWTLQKLQNDEKSLGPAFGTLVSAAAALVFISNSNKKKREAILKYNENLESKSVFTIDPSKKGLGIVISF